MDALGVNKAKRRIAKQVGADPYTTNPVLAKQLDDLARAAFAAASRWMSRWAYRRPAWRRRFRPRRRSATWSGSARPQDMRTINTQKLANMGVGSDTIRPAIRHESLAHADDLGSVRRAPRTTLRGEGPRGRGRARQRRRERRRSAFHAECGRHGAHGGHGTRSRRVRSSSPGAFSWFARAAAAWRCPPPSITSCGPSR